MIAVICKYQHEYRDWLRVNIPNKTLHKRFIPCINMFDVAGRSFKGIFFVRPEYNPHREYRYIQTKGQDTHINLKTDLMGILKYVSSLQYNITMETKTYEKKEILTQVFHTINRSNPITYGEVAEKFDFQPGDLITAGYNEGFYSENNSMDPHYEFTVHRLILETDEAFEKRLEQGKRDKDEMKSRRFKNYLKLKEEFGPSEND